MRLAAEGGRGDYGMYESLDYTASRVPEGQKVAVVRTYFAHHQGMTLVAFANVLTGGAMRSRFHAEPIVKAVELLLQERTPRDVLVASPRAEEVCGGARARAGAPGGTAIRHASRPHSTNASAVERPLRCDAHGGGIGL